MKVMTILGTRPEIIRLSRVIQMLDIHCHHILVYTGQNYTHGLSTLFFKQLKIRQPDNHLHVKGTSFGTQASALFTKIENLLIATRPDRVLILGDTNSGLSAIVAKRMGIPIYHMEAGNRSFDEAMPEEVNRRIIDHVSDIHMPYTERSRYNLLREGIANNKIYVIGNPIYEVIVYYSPQIHDSKVLKYLKLNEGAYILTTAHRSESINSKNKLSSLIHACSCLADKFKVPCIFSLHPHTADMMRKWGIEQPANVLFHKPFGFFDFVKLEMNAMCVITDSGTVQEECAIFKVPNVTIRTTTERPETIECGSNILAGVDIDSITRAAWIVMYGKLQDQVWQSPNGYEDTNVSSKVAKIVLGY